MVDAAEAAGTSAAAPAATSSAAKPDVKSKQKGHSLDEKPCVLYLNVANPSMILLLNNHGS